MGDSTHDDLDQMREMGQKLDDQDTKLQTYEKNEAKLIEEVKMLRNKLHESENKVERLDNQVTELEERNADLRRDN